MYHFCLSSTKKFSTTSAELQRDHGYHFHASPQSLLGIAMRERQQYEAKYYGFFVDLEVSTAFTVSLGVCVAFRHPSALWFIRSRSFLFFLKGEKGRKTLALQFTPSTTGCWRVVKADRKTFLTFYNGSLRGPGHFFWTNKISNNLNPITGSQMITTETRLAEQCTVR